MYFLSKEDTLDKLSSSFSGIKSNEVCKRMEQYGKNVLKEKRRENIIVTFLRQFKNLMVFVLLLSALITIVFAIVTKEFADLIDAFIILFIVILNAIIGVVQENKAQASIDSLKKAVSRYCKVIREGTVLKIDLTELVCGDVVLLEAGDIVPADLRLLESHQLKCDESSLTGESFPVDKNSSLVLPSNTTINEQYNMAFSGCMVCAGRGKGIVTAVGDSTEIGKIANLLFSTKKDQTPLQKAIQKIGKFITYSVLFVCLIIFILEIFFSKEMNIMTALMTSVALAVAAIPESLPAVITIIMALGVTQLAKRKVIIKQLHAIETLGSCEIICSDKTGTLTQNKMTVTKVVTNNSFVENLNSYNHMIQCMYLCNDSKLSNGNVIGEPTENALYEYVLPYVKKHNYKRIYEMPFDSNRKMMTTVYNLDKITSYTKGAFDSVIKKCTHILLDGKKMILDKNIMANLQSFNNQMTKNSMRVLAFCFKEFDEYNYEEEVEEDMTFLGLVGMIDPPRTEVYDAIKKCFKAGLKPIMITGDHKNTAFAIAKQLEIASKESEVLTGDEINAMSDNDFFKNITKYTVFARVSPEHKVKIVQALKKLDKIVAMTGDGINDAPSLKMSNIGVGMGTMGTDVVKSVADMVVTDDNFASIVVAIEEGRKVYKNIQKALQYLLSTNAIEVFGVLLALIIYPNIIFLTAVQMLFINLVTDSLPAFALGVEKAEKDIMLAPPRKSKESVFSKEIKIGILYQSILQLVLVMGVFCYAAKTFKPEVANTMVFFTIIFVQTIHSINAKSNKSIFDIKLFENKIFNICFLITIILNISIACMPFCYRLFDLTHLAINQWIIVSICSIAIIPLVELVKLFLNKKTKSKA